jgi:hypothetical protein
MNKIRINQGRIIPSQYRFIITAGIIFGIFLLISRVNNELGFILCLVLSFGIFPVWTSFFMLEIDMKNNCYRDYYTIMGRSFGVKLGVFHAIHGAKILESKTIQTTYGMGASGHTRHGREYSAYLLINENEKVFLISDEDKEDLLERLSPILKKLKTELKSS